LSQDSLELSQLREQLHAELQRNRLLQDELDATNQGLLALTLELEKKREEVQFINQQLLQVDRMATMGELAASIAHELNNPLATISLRAESLVSRFSPNDSAYRSLQIISQEVERMAALVTNLLEFSRRSQRQFITIDVCQEIEYALELINYHFRKNRIKVKRDYRPLVQKLQADRQELQQLFLNLFTNACDAMPEGGTLTIEIKTDSITNCVAINFTDTGIGINHNDLAKVMDPYFTTKPEGKGTGLGLSICRRIVQEHHGGSIIITSEVGKGTTILIKLPIVN